MCCSPPDSTPQPMTGPAEAGSFRAALVQMCSGRDVERNVSNATTLIRAAATGAGAGTDFTGAPTAKLQLKSAGGTSHSIETSEALSAEIEKRESLCEELKTYLQMLAKRMQTPRPDVFVTLHGLPLSMQQFSTASNVLQQ